MSVQNERIAGYYVNRTSVNKVQVIVTYINTGKYVSYCVERIEQVFNSGRIYRKAKIAETFEDAQKIAQAYKGHGNA